MFRLLTNKTIIFMSKIVRQWLKNCDPVQVLFLGTACGVSPLKSRIIAHHHLCLQKFEGKCSISILKICVEKCL